MSEAFASILTEGTRNSLGRVDEVIETVLADKSRLEELYQCFFHDDMWARMRAADAFEKICRTHPEWIVPYIDRIQTGLHSSSQPSIQWHIAQIYQQVELSHSQRTKAIEWLYNCVATTDVDWIVSANVMEALVYFAHKNLTNKSKVLRILAVQSHHHSKAVVRKSAKLLETLMMTDFDWLNVPAEIAARRLLGCELVRELDGQMLRVKIVETEAYDQSDEASHTFRGRTKRNEAMFRSAGHMYVYFTYGMHYCCNVVCGEEGIGSGVLIRAVEPLEGMEIIEQRRGMKGVNVTNGPGKVCAALGIDLLLTGHDLAHSPLQLVRRPELASDMIVTGVRIGISRAVHHLRRFYLRGNRYVSQK